MSGRRCFQTITDHTNGANLCGRVQMREFSAQERDINLHIVVLRLGFIAPDLQKQGLLGENNFPIANVPINAGNKRTVNRLNNGVHPSVDGYDQIGDTFFCWMKSALAAQDKSAGKK